MTQETREFEFSAVIASAVHDMKNSLSMLLGAVDEIIGNCDPQKCPSFTGFEHLKYEGNRVNHSLIQLLALYRINNDQYALNLDEHDVEECVEEVYLESQGLLAMKGIKAEMESEEGLTWYFDRGLVLGLLGSVINNAYKYTRSRIRVSATVENNYLAISIDDDGAGYPAAMLHADSEHKPGINYQSGSTGLGLYFASQLAAMHENRGRRGYITTGNDGIEGGGRFTIYLP